RRLVAVDPRDVPLQRGRSEALARRGVGARFPWQFWWQYARAPEGIRGHSKRAETAKSLIRPPSCLGFRSDSQAGRRRFDPGRPLSRKCTTERTFLALPRNGAERSPV